jgi:D-alanyl-D-alanine carboxypeptidase
MSGNSRTGNGETQLPVDHPTLRGRPGVVAGLLSALAVTVAVHPAEARHSHHASHASSRASHESHESPAHESSGGPRYADIVLDANSGAVLHAANADELRHPASLTKIMTLYLLFERLEAGKLRLDSQLPVSEHAAAQAPTKLGLRPEQSLEVEDAIRGLVTKSANDAAVVIAEAIGGDEHEFAEMMTHKAHALGMSRTLYRNASGLPNDEQVTTARDQALLGRAIQERFPRYYRYFATPSFTYHGETMRNHNHLLGHVEGLDGIKTGYTQASGFNLVTSVKRNNRLIVSVVLGGASSGARDARMRSLIEEYIVAASPQKSATAVAEATREPPVVEARTVETRTVETRGAEAWKPTREARPAKQPAAPATFSVASVGRPVTWPAPSAVPSAAPLAGSALGGVAASPPIATDSGPTAAVSAAKPAPTPTDPIRPIQVKTVKVKLHPTQVAAVASPPLAQAPEQIAMAEPPQDRAPPAPPQAAAAPQLAPAPKPSAPQKAGMLGVLSLHSPAPTAAEPKRDPAAVREVASLPSAPQAVPVQAAAPQSAPQAAAHPAPAPAHTGWIIQVGAFDIERDARQKLSAVQAMAAQVLGHASPFTEAVTKGDKTLYRARFAGLQKDEAEAACRQLKRNDIDCMTIRN